MAVLAIALAAGLPAPPDTAYSRRTLGFAAGPRLIVLNAGVAALTFAVGPGFAPLAVAGLAAVVLAGLVAIGMLVASLGRRTAPAT